MRQSGNRIIRTKIRTYLTLAGTSLHDRWAVAGAALDPDGKSLHDRWVAAGADLDPDGKSLRDRWVAAGADLDPDGKSLHDRWTAAGADLDSDGTSLHDRWVAAGADLGISQISKDSKDCGYSSENSPTSLSSNGGSKFAPDSNKQISIGG